MQYIYLYHTKIGRIGIAENGASITHLFLPGDEIKDFQIQETELIQQAAAELMEYLDGRRREFNLPLQPDGTKFMKMVWKELCNIPYGKVCTYQEIAKRIGRPNACRAVGLANHRNPIPIFIPFS